MVEVETWVAFVALATVFVSGFAIGAYWEALLPPRNDPPDAPYEPYEVRFTVPKDERTWSERVDYWDDEPDRVYDADGRTASEYNRYFRYLERLRHENNDE